MIRSSVCWARIRLEVKAIELEAGGLQRLGAGLGLLDAELGQVRVLPAGEEVFQVPFALAVADKDERSGHGDFPFSGVSGSGGFDQWSARPSTSSME
jgi:hypothetical protein